MIRIAIIGSPCSGKSTVCRNVLKHVNCTYGGMTSAEIREKGERVGFEIRDIATEKHMGYWRISRAAGRVWGAITSISRI